MRKFLKCEIIEQFAESIYTITRAVIKITSALIYLKVYWVSFRASAKIEKKFWTHIRKAVWFKQLKFLLFKQKKECLKLADQNPGCFKKTVLRLYIYIEALGHSFQINSSYSMNDFGQINSDYFGPFVGWSMTIDFVKGSCERTVPSPADRLIYWSVGLSLIQIL